MNNFKLGFQKSKPLKRNFLLVAVSILLFLASPLPSHAVDSGPSQGENPNANPVDTFIVHNEAQQRAENCNKAKEQVQSIQTKLFGLDTGAAPKETYLDLLKQRDEIMGKKVVIKALLNIWDKYNSYLDENDKYNITPASVKGSLKGLTDLKSLLSNSNPQNIQKYQLMSDVFKGIDVTGIKGDNHQKNFYELKSRLQESCNKTENSQLMYCVIAQNAQDQGQNIWDSFKPGLAPTAPPNSPQAMLHKFLDASSSALGHEVGGWWRNLSSMFVDNDRLKYDLVGNENLSQNVSLALDKAIKICRAQLLDPTKNADCMKQDIGQYIPEQEATEIKKYFGKDNMNAQDVVDQYLANSAHVAQAHEEVTGGLISKFSALAQQHASDSSASPGTADFDMEQGIAHARENFYQQSALDVAQLSRHLNMLKRNDDLYFNYRKDDSVKHAYAAQSPIAKKANAQLNKILQDIDADSESIDIFESQTKPNGEQELHIEPHKFLKMLRMNKISKDKLNKLLQNTGAGDLGVDQKLANIDAKIAQFKSNTEFNLLEGLKKFAWKQVIAKCSSSTNPETKLTIVDNTSCATTNTFSELNKLLKFGDRYLTYQNYSSGELNLNAVDDNCKVLQKEQPEIYKNGHYSEICHKVYDQMKVVAARNEYYSPKRVSERASVNTTWVNDQQTGSYRSKSWLELMPGALQMAMPTGMQLGSTWVQTQGVRNQMYGLTTYMKYRYNSMQMQYNQGVQMCNQTLSCYYNSQYQAFLPSYGQTGVTNYGTNAFLSNTTFMNP